MKKEFKDFIKYPEALALKELGFDEPCLGITGENFPNEIEFCVDDYATNSEFDELTKELEEEREENDEPIENVVSAPTYSQAFRWFRKKYFIYHRIDRDYDDWTYELCEFKSGNKHIPTGFKKFNSYEEAELACLRKLIEIVKNK